MRVVALRCADVLYPRGQERPALVHEVASLVRALDGAADGVGEAQSHDRMVCIGSFAGPRAEPAAEPVDGGALGELIWRKTCSRAESPSGLLRRTGDGNTKGLLLSSRAASSV